MKIIVIGCTHTGTTAVKEILKNEPTAEISVYEINDNISFLSCGIALCVGNVVEDINNLFYSSPQQLEKDGVKMFTRHKVVSIDREKRQIKAINLNTNEELIDTYDKLVISTGSWPIVPPFEGLELQNVMLSKNFKHAQDIILKAPNAKKVAVIGAGYIGVELAEAFKHLNKEVVLVDLEPNIMGKYFDDHIVKIVEDTFTKNNIELALGEKVIRFEGNNHVVSKVVTDKRTIEADLVILCIGFKPNTDIFKNVVDTLPNGAIVVDEYMRTSDPNIFAGGDAVTLNYLPDHSKSYLPLATNALRTGTIIGKNIKENTVKHPGTNATSSIKVFNYNISTTGLTKNEAIKRGINAESITVTDNHLLEFMDGSKETTLTVVYDIDSRRVIGGQYITEAFLPQTINVISMMIHYNTKIDELPYLDFYFLPHFNKPWNIINLVGLNIKK
jgi:NADPH-dependent 2,4-dienoyl-CoA reductase/sulfur reductase-like enzyme